MAGSRRFSFSLATEAEDGELRALLRQIAMPGTITLAFAREPSFFLAEHAGNVTSQVIACRDTQSGHLVGMGSRSIRCIYIDGKPTRAGYLSMLRGIPQARGNIALARGYQYLHTLHLDGAVPYYFTTILDDNREASALLTSQRAGLPIYQPVARLITYLIPLSGTGRGVKSSAAVSKVEREQLQEAVAFQQMWNSRYQFAPMYTLQDMLGESDLLPGFSWKHLYVYREQGKVSGTLGVWDQQAFKQTVVTAYSREMQLVRPWYNMLASMRRYPRLPRVGAPITVLYAAFLSGRMPVLSELLRTVWRDWSGKGYDYLSVGLCEQHEFSNVVARYATQKIASTMYLVYWPDEEVTLPKPDIPVHLEVATL